MDRSETPLPITLRHQIELARLRVDDQPVHRHAFREQRVVSEDRCTLLDALLHGVKSLQPRFQPDPRPFQGINDGTGNPPVRHLLHRSCRLDPGHATIVVTHHADFLRSQFIDGDEQAACNVVEGVGDDRPGVLDDLGVPVSQIHRFGQQLSQTGVHAGQDHQFFVREFGGPVGFVLLVFDECTVMFQDFI